VRFCSSQVVDAGQVLLAFDAHAHPDMGGPIEERAQLFQAFRPLREDLIMVPVRLVHDAEHTPNVLHWDLVVEKVAHAVHEDPLRGLPRDRVLQHVGLECQFEPVAVVLVSHGLQAVRESLRVAMLTAWANLVATRHRVPRRVGPFDWGVRGHGAPFRPYFGR